MITPITDCCSDLKEKLDGVISGVKVYDPDDMIDMTAHLAPPFTGLVYMGLNPNGLDSQGLSAKMLFGIYVLGTKKNLKVKGKGCPTGNDAPPSEEMLVGITTFLETIRGAIGNTQSPSNHKWQLLSEKPYDFDDQGVGYLQVWQTTVNSI